MSRLLTAITLALVCWTLAACGMSHMERLEYAGKTADNLWRNGHPKFTALAVAEAKKCRDASPSSQPVPLAECPAADSWYKALKALRAACDAVDAAVIIGGPMALTDNPAVEGWVKAALEAIQRGIRISQQAGVLPAGG